MLRHALHASILIFALHAQEEVLPPLIAPPAPVEIPPVPTLPPLKNSNLDPAQIAPPTMPSDVKITIGGNVKFDPLQPTIFQLSGPIHLTTNANQDVFADSAILNTETKTYALNGNISIYQGNTLQHCDQATYDYSNKKLITQGLSVSLDPILLQSGSFQVQETPSGGYILEGHNAGITTHDVAKPNFWLQSEKTTIFPDDRIVFDDLRLMIGDRSIFWLPYLSQPLNSELGYRFIPGGRTNWGLYLLNTYGIMLGHDDLTSPSDDRWLLSQWHLDFRSIRGVATGVDFFDTRITQQHDNFGWLKLYYAYDMSPDRGRSGIPRGDVDSNRWNIQLQHRIPLDLTENQSQWALNFDLHPLSDNHFLEDFDPKFYRENSQPDNTITLTRKTEHTLLTGLARLRPNDFYRSDTRTPEVLFDLTKRPLFNTPILHEGSASFGFYQEEMSDPVRKGMLNDLITLPVGSAALARALRNVGRYEQFLIGEIRSLPVGDNTRAALMRQLINPSFTRFHTYQELSSQFHINNIIHMTPRIGAGYTRYADVAGPAPSTERTLFSAGLEASMKWQRDFPEINSAKWGIQSLRHVFQPYAQWSYLSTDDLGAYYPQIDRLTFTTRPLPINPTRFTAIDALENWNLIRTGVRNHLLTKRDDDTHTWLTMDTYLDCYLNDPELNRNFSNLYNDINWEPLPWLALNLETQFPILNNGSEYSEYTVGMNFMPTPDTEITVSNEILSGHPLLQDSNLIRLRAYHRINDDWGAGFVQRWELDDSTIEEQQYTLHRNYDNWIVSAGISHRNNRLEEEYGFLLNFTLKDFPSISLPFKIDAD